MSGQAGRYTRSFNGMVGAMVVVVLAVVAFVMFRESVRSEVAPAVQPIEYTKPAEFAQEQAGFEILAPPTLPEGWRATSVRFTPGAQERWHLGMLTEEDRYVGLEQARSTVRTMVETHVDEDAEEGRPVTIAGESWERWTDEGGDLALVRKDDDDVTTLVVGSRTPLEELVAFVESLR